MRSVTHAAERASLQEPMLVSILPGKRRLEEIPSKNNAQPVIVLRSVMLRAGGVPR